MRNRRNHFFVLSIRSCVDSSIRGLVPSVVSVLVFIFHFSGKIVWQIGFFESKDDLLGSKNRRNHLTAQPRYVFVRKQLNRLKENLFLGLDKWAISSNEDRIQQNSDTETFVKKLPKIKKLNLLYLSKL